MRLFSPKRKTLQNKRGVALIFFALIFGVMLSFSLLVINTGTIVYQKMQLQSAVDLAAYSAASVKAAYLGNDQSGENSIAGINQKILQRWSRLLEDLKGPYPGIWIPMNPSFAACMASCQAANFANAQMAVSLYKDAASDIEELHQEAREIIQSLPAASRRAAEETLKQNIPELALSDGFSGGGNEVTNELNEVIEDLGVSSFSDDDYQNAVLTFSSDAGAYLANVVANVPHTYPYYGPACQNKNADKPGKIPLWYCMVNGAGYGGGEMAWAMAAAAYARSFSPVMNGNVGTIQEISDPDANAIKINFVENAHKPDPFVVVAAEWFPTSGSAYNLESIVAGAGDLFPDRTRLVSVAAAEPFGSSLAKSDVNYGTRLQSVRRLLLDPRLTQVKDDYRDVFDYMEYLSPVDGRGQATESAEEVIRRFLH